MLVKFLVVRRVSHGGGGFHRFLVEWEVKSHGLHNQRLPDEAHWENDDVTDVVELAVDAPPLVEAQICEWYEAVAGDDERVQLADHEYGHAARDGLSGFLELRVVFQVRLEL